MINQSLARKFFPDVNPIGRTFRPEGGARKLDPPVEVVGITKDAKYESVREETYPTVFRPIAQVDDSMTRERLLAALSAFFGGLALLLATVGLYGTLSYLVAQRRIEFGIRLALGATSRSILGLVIRDVTMLLLGGIAAGIGLSLATTRLLGAMLFGIQARDPVTMAMGGALMAVVSLAAGLVAARRATKVDPMVALRQE